MFGFANKPRQPVGSTGVCAFAAFPHATALCVGLVVIVGAILMPDGAPVWAKSNSTGAARIATDHSQTGLTLAPVGQNGQYFSVTVKPSDTRDLAVLLVNSGLTAEKFRTYAADVFTLAGGGMGAKPDSQQRTGATTWLKYPSLVGTLNAAESDKRAVSVHVPANTAPGQYISSLVIENAEPSAVADTVGLKQVIRTVVAVSIRVPGALSPKFHADTASIRHSAGESILVIGLINDGNARLKPTGTLRVRNGSQILYDQPVSFDSFFAHTSTTLEIRLPDVLPNGRYTSELVLADPETKTAMSGAVPSVLIGPELPSSPQPSSIALFAIITAGALAALSGSLSRARRRRKHGELRPDSL